MPERKFRALSLRVLFRCSPTRMVSLYVCSLLVLFNVATAYTSVNQHSAVGVPPLRSRRIACCVALEVHGSCKTLSWPDLLEVQATRTLHSAQSTRTLHSEDLNGSQGRVVPTRTVVRLPTNVKDDTATTKDDTATTKEIISFGIPVSALFLSNFALGAVDTAATGHFAGLQDLAALAPGCSAMEYACYVLSAMATVTLNQLAPTDPGSSEWHDRLKTAASLVLIAASLHAASTFIFADGLSRLVGCPPEVVSRAASYLRWRAPGIIPFHLAAACSSAFFASKDSVTPFTGTLIAVVINIIGDLYLCPRLGLVGAAAATSFSQLCLLVFLFSRLWAKGLVPPTLFSGFAPRRKLVQLARFVAPTSVLTLLRTSLYAVLSFWCCQMGLVSSAAQQIAATVFWGSTSAAGEPMSAAAQTFVPARYEAWLDANQQARAAALKGDVGLLASAEAAVGRERHAMVHTIRRLLKTCLLFGSFGLLGVSWVTQVGPLHIFTSNAAAISQVPQGALIAMGILSPMALLFEGTLLSFGARTALVRCLAGGVTLCFGVGAILMQNPATATVKAIWWVAALFQLCRMIGNGLILRHKISTPPA